MNCLDGLMVWERRWWSGGGWGGSGSFSVFLEVARAFDKIIHSYFYILIFVFSRSHKLGKLIAYFSFKTVASAILTITVMCFSALLWKRSLLVVVFSIARVSLWVVLCKLDICMLELTLDLSTYFNFQRVIKDIISFLYGPLCSVSVTTQHRMICLHVFCQAGPLSRVDSLTPKDAVTRCRLIHL